MPDDGHRRRTVLKTALATAGGVAAIGGNATAVQDLRSISYGQTRSGIVDSDDPSSPFYGDDAYVEPVEFDGDAGDQIRVEMRSDDFDAYLTLLGPDGARLQSDDDGSTGTDAQLEYTLSSDGTYTINAGTRASGSTGSYELTLSLLGRQTDTPTAAPETGLDLRSIEYGETRAGEIDGSDPTGYYGHYEPVEFDGEEGDVVTITMTSAGDPRLLLLDPAGTIVTQNDDGGIGDFDSRIRDYRLSRDGTYTIVATTYDPSDLIEYDLGLSRGSADSTPTDTPTDTPTETPPPSTTSGLDLRSIEYGETRAGEIDGSDPTGYYGHYEPVEFDGEEGDVVTITMSSPGDPRLLLLDPAGTIVARNDDRGAFNFDSQIQDYRLSQDGQYTIVATTYDTADLIEYDLSLSRGGTAETPTDTPTDTPPPSTTSGLDLRFIGYGETRAGEIDGSDPTGYYGHYEPVEFDGEEGDVVTITMTSTGDPRLLLLNPSGTIIAENDDGEGMTDFNSKIDGKRLPTDGTYTIVATTYSPSDLIEYDLSLSRGGTAETPTDTPTDTPPPSTTSGRDLRFIEYGETRAGEIDGSDPTGYYGHYEPVEFDGEEGDVVTITMTSTGDPRILLLNPSGTVIAENDDGEGMTDFDSKIDGKRLPTDGTYTIVATTYSPSDLIEYDLSLSRGGPADTPTDTPAGGGLDLRSISYGETRDGEIDGSDPTGYHGHYEPVEFDGEEGDVVTITMTSPGDPRILLLNPSGTIIAENNDGEGMTGFNSKIAGKRLPADGTYTIVATTWSASELIDYELTLRRSSSEDTSGSGEYLSLSTSDIYGNRVGETIVEVHHTEEPTLPSDVDGQNVTTVATTQTSSDGVAVFSGEDGINLSDMSEYRDRYAGMVLVSARLPASSSPNGNGWFGTWTASADEFFSQSSDGRDIQLQNELIFGPEVADYYRGSSGVATVWRRIDPQDTTRQTIFAEVSRADTGTGGIGTGQMAVRVPESLTVDYTGKHLAWAGHGRQEPYLGSFALHQDNSISVPLYPLFDSIVYDEFGQEDRELSEDLRTAKSILKGVAGFAPYGVGTLFSLGDMMSSLVSEIIVDDQDTVVLGQESIRTDLNSQDLVKTGWNHRTYSAAYSVPLNIENTTQLAVRGAWTGMGRGVQFNVPFQVTPFPPELG